MSRFPVESCLLLNPQQIMQIKRQKQPLCHLKIQSLLKLRKFKIEKVPQNPLKQLFQSHEAEGDDFKSQRGQAGAERLFPFRFHFPSPSLGRFPHLPGASVLPACIILATSMWTPFQGRSVQDPFCCLGMFQNDPFPFFSALTHHPHLLASSS